MLGTVFFPETSLNMQDLLDKKKKVIVKIPVSSRAEGIFIDPEEIVFAQKSGEDLIYQEMLDIDFEYRTPNHSTLEIIDWIGYKPFKSIRLDLTHINVLKEGIFIESDFY